MASYNIVLGDKMCNFFRQKSKHFKTNLGHSVTMDRANGDRLLSQSDKFAFFYNNRYKASIYSKGFIGDIRFYVDFEIGDDVLAFYWDEEEYVFQIEMDKINEKGIDFYLGYLLKQVHEKQEERKEREELKKSKSQDSENTRIGDPSKVINTPWDVSYADIVAYMEKQRSERLKV